MDILLQSLTALGTITVAVLAIWGQFFRSKWAGPKLMLEPHNLRGNLTQFTNGRKVIYYHLKVVNRRVWAPARNCRVLLKQIHHRGPDQNFQPLSLAVPPQFVWAPAEFAPAVLDITKEQILDFGNIVENGKRFEPVLYSHPNNFRGFVGPNEAVRFSLEIVADGFASSRYQVFEVAWDGRWSDNIEEMAEHLVVKEIKNSDAERV